MSLMLEIREDFSEIKEELGEVMREIQTKSHKIIEEISSIKDIINLTFGLVTDIRYKDGIEKVDAAYTVFLTLKNLNELSSYAFELRVNATQNLDPERIKEYLSMIMPYSGVKTCRAILHYVIIVLAKYLQIMVAYHIHIEDTESVQQDFEKFDSSFQQITKNYQRVTGEEFIPGDIPQISEIKRQLRDARNIPDEVKENMTTTLYTIPSDVEKFLNDAGLTEFEETFTNEELSLDNILELNHDNLKEIGITKLGQRIRILKGIENFKAKSKTKLSKRTRILKGIENIKA